MSNVISHARPYAKALFTKAKGDHRVNEVLSWLEALAIVFATPAVAKCLADPRVGQDKIIAECLPVLGDRLTDGDKNFLYLLAENKRVSLIPSILAVYTELQLANLNKVAVTVTTSQALTEAQRLMLKNSLEQKYRGAVDLTYQVDASLLGGMVLRTRDEVLDGSVKEQLRQLNQSINEYA